MTYSFKLDNQIYKVNIEEEDNNVVVQVNGEEYPIEYTRLDENLYSIIINDKSFTIGKFKQGKQVQVFHAGNLYELEAISDRELSKSGSMGSGLEILAPMPSRVVKILKSEGDEVAAGEAVVVVEAMKMESELKALQAGKIKYIKISEGDAVEAKTLLVVLTED
jgi:acetyl/propionyl-CoA carboxylase alpha subunit